MHSLGGLPRAAWVAVPFWVLWSFGAHAALATPAPPQASALDFVVGTWTGTSVCVGERPTCQNETVVYRIVPVEGQPAQVRMLGDKIVDGKRLPMGALVFDVDAQRRTLRCEFRARKTHGVWTFTVAGDSMKGTLVILPDGSMARDVAVHRANDSDLPEAPPLSDYED